VEFVGERIRDREGNAPQGGPGTPREPFPAAEAAVQEKGEHSVLGQVRKLAQEKVEEGEGVRGQTEVCPAQNLLKHPDGERAAEGARREIKDQPGPNRGRQPPEGGREMAIVRTLGGRAIQADRVACSSRPALRFFRFRGSLSWNLECAIARAHVVACLQGDSHARGVKLHARFQGRFCPPVRWTVAPKVVPSWIDSYIPLALGGEVTS
jgi:hypothetical protein